MPSYSLAGSGSRATLWAQTLSVLGNPRLGAVGSRVPDHARHLAGAHGATAVDPEQLPAGADWVIVAGAPATHAADALHGVARGAAVVVEAPLCTTLDDADRLVEAAMAGGFVAYGENLLYAPLVRELLHRSSGLGALHYLEARVVQQPPPRPVPADGRWGGGVLFDVGVHALAVLLTVAGSDHPVQVTARFEREASASPWAAEDHAVVDLRFASGARGRLEVSGRAGTPQWDLQVAAERSAMRLELLPEPHLEYHGVELPRPPRRYPRIQPVQLETFGYLDQAVELVRELDDAVPAPWLGAGFGRYVLDVLCGAYRAAGTCRPEPLPFGGSRRRTPWQHWRDTDELPG